MQNTDENKRKVRQNLTSIEGGNHRGKIDYSHARENILGGYAVESERAATGKQNQTKTRAGRPASGSVSARQYMEGGVTSGQRRMGQTIYEQHQNAKTPVNAEKKTQHSGTSKKSMKYKDIGAALLGMLIVVAAGGLILTFIPRLYGLICAFLPVSSVVCYIKICGRRRKSKRPYWIIGVTSLIGILLLGFLSDITASALSSSVSLGRSLKMFGANIRDLHYWGQKLYCALIPAVFVMLGMMISVKYTFKRVRRS